MQKVARFAVTVIALTIGMTAFGQTAMAAEVTQTKYWAGAGGESLCDIPYTGQSFFAQPGTKYRVTVRPIAGGTDAQAKIRFVSVTGKLGSAETFMNEKTGVVPADAAEAWVTICHTNPEVSYGPVVVPLPVKIDYTDGIVQSSR